MAQDIRVEQLFEALVEGDRTRARQLVDLAAGELGPDELITDLFWPAHEMIENLHRADQLSALAYRFSTRLLRVLVDQNAAKLVMQPPLGRTVLASCGPDDGNDLSAQMAVDMLEHRGFTVRFAGGGIPADELIAVTNQTSPDVLLMFCPSPQDLPAVRQIIDRLREINACPNTQIVVGGGVFNRAEGLAEEIGADLWASDPLDLAEEMLNGADRRAETGQRTVGRRRRPRLAA